MSMQEFAIGSWTLCRTGTDDEPKISDLELARKLGYEHRLRDLRKRIKRYIDDKILNDVEVRATVAQTSGGRPGIMYMLNEQQALFVAARCETEIAHEILKEMIQVFTLARRGMLPVQQNTAQGLDAVQFGTAIARAIVESCAASNAMVVENVTRSNTAMIESVNRIGTSLVESMNKTSAMMAENNTKFFVVLESSLQKIMDKNLQEHIIGTHLSKDNIGPDGAKRINEKIRQIAEVYWPDDARGQKSVRSELQLNLRSEVHFYGTRSSWCYLPQDKWQVAMKWLTREYRSALKRVVDSGGKPPKPGSPASQMSFDWGDPEDPKKSK